MIVRYLLKLSFLIIKIHDIFKAYNQTFNTYYYIVPFHKKDKKTKQELKHKKHNFNHIFSKRLIKQAKLKKF